MGRPSVVTLPTGETISYQYDARGNVTEIRRSASWNRISSGVQRTMPPARSPRPRNATSRTGRRTRKATGRHTRTARRTVTCLRLHAPPSTEYSRSPRTRTRHTRRTTRTLQVRSLAPVRVSIT
ncbi:MAG: RHS repeat protein [Steroidobacteraceae bacterium]|nr:RHS repeat protein [Steroidobacteraceae bacterium]